MALSISTISDFFSRRFRTRRMRAAVELMGITPETRVLDIGGTLFNWRLLPFQPKLVILNTVLDADSPHDVHWIRADGCRLPFDDQSFEVCFSNSVIEHVGDSERQRRFAEEVRRVGQRYYVQTPNYWFPIEPHLLTPLIHWLPKAWQRPLLRRFTVWGILMRPSEAERDEFVEDTNLLRRGDVHRLFPDGEIQDESVLGLTKSFVIARRTRPE